MKKLFTLALSMAAMAAVAYGEELTAEAGSVGVLQVTTSQKNIVIAAAFNNLDGSTMTLDNLVKTTSMKGGEKLYVYSGSAFKGWQYNSSTKVWDAMSTADMTEDGVPSVAAGGAASEQTCAYGSGIWFQQDAANSVTLTIYGKPLTTSPSATAVSGTMLLANPNASATSPTITNPSKGDIIRVPDDTLTQTTYTYNGSNWTAIDSETHLPVALKNSPSIAAGTGFWYKAKGSSTTVAW